MYKANRDAFPGWLNPGIPVKEVEDMGHLQQERLLEETCWRKRPKDNGSHPERRKWNKTDNVKVDQKSLLPTSSPCQGLYADT